jgi:hypothetical protein
MSRVGMTSDAPLTEMRCTTVIGGDVQDDGTVITNGAAPSGEAGRGRTRGSGRDSSGHYLPHVLLS